MNVARALPCILAIFLLLLSRLAGQSNDEAPLAIALTFRSTAAEAIEVGEPLHVAVRLSVPRGSTSPVVLAPPAGTWVEAIAVELLPAAGRGPALRAMAVGQPEAAAVTLDPNHVAGGQWRFTANATGLLAAGDYVVRARLAIASGEGWTGSVQGERTLRLVNASAEGEGKSRRTLSLVRDAMLDGRLQEAAALADGVLVTTPDDWALLIARAGIAERAGNRLAALLCLERASAALAKDASSHPSLELEAMRRRIADEDYRQPGSLESIPDWSWPPSILVGGNENAGDDFLRPALSPTADLPPVASLPAASSFTREPAVVPSAENAAGVPPQGAAARTATARTGLLDAGTTTASEPSPALIGAVIAKSELNDAKIRAESSGQWASGATASSQYGPVQYAAAQATGAPNVMTAGNSPDAWCPANKDTGTEWLEVAFAKPVYATEVRVRQNDAPGAIAKIEAIEPDGTAHLWWQGVDPSAAPGIRDIVWFAVRVPRTPYLVGKVRISLNLSAVPGWKEIDAVQLVGTLPE